MHALYSLINLEHMDCTTLDQGGTNFHINLLSITWFHFE